MLLVDDDPSLRDVVRVALELNGFQVVEAPDGRRGLELAKTQDFSVVLLDLMMPELDGLEVCKAIRAFSRVPIVFVSSRDEELDRVLGLELGGDDYIGKPFAVRELVARVRAVVRRAAPVAPTGVAPRVLVRGKLELDAEAWRVTYEGRPVTLTVMEFQLLRTLAQTPQKVFTRDELIERAYDGVVVSDRTVDSHLRRVRQKLAAVGAPEAIETVHGVGYRLGV